MRTGAITMLCAAAGVVGMAVPAEAALLTGEYTDVPPSQSGTSLFVNFADEGTLDWAVWDPASGASNVHIPTSSKLNTDFISNAFIVGTGALGRVGGTDLEISTTPGATSGSATAGAVSSNALRTIGNGAGLTITVDTTGQYVARIYVGGYKAEGTITATLPGTAGVQHTQAFGPNAGSKHAGIFELEFQADSLASGNNVLDVRITYSGDVGGPTPSDSNSHVLLQGATLALVPEPASLSLLSLAGLGMLARSRRA